MEKSSTATVECKVPEHGPNPQILSLRTQLVSQGHTKHLIAETDMMTMHMHCYGPKGGENGLHAHTEEDHIFVQRPRRPFARTQKKSRDFSSKAMFLFVFERNKRAVYSYPIWGEPKRLCGHAHRSRRSPDPGAIEAGGRRRPGSHR
jgi:hypothetical protein